MKNLQGSYEEYDPKKVEKKSREFLKRIMGDEKFDKFHKEGKIEIHKNSNDKIIVYELYSDGRVINKTKKQHYCIVSNRSDYPTDDMIAIKYAWLIHKNDVVEKIANKSPLTNIIRPGYNDFVDYMEGRGWRRESITILNNDNTLLNNNTTLLNNNANTISISNNNYFVYTRSINKGTTGSIVDIRCPENMKITIMGTQQVPRGYNYNNAHSLGLYITNENGKEIPDDTKIRITKEKICETIIQLARMFYGDIKMTQNGDTSYRFHHGIELNCSDSLKIYAVNPECNIPAENIKFVMKTDIWNMY